MWSVFDSIGFYFVILVYGDFKGDYFYLEMYENGIYLVLLEYFFLIIDLVKFFYFYYYCG